MERTQILQISIRDIVDGYKDSDEDGVKAYHGKLNVRPAYQREYCYDNKGGVKQEEVIRTIQKGYPLGFFYWVENEDGTYEILDGQQRTLSFCRYVENLFSLQDTQKKFRNLPKDKQDEILDYKIFVCICKGTISERLEWFTIINTEPYVMTQQELLNAHYTGPWLTSAKKFFSKTNCTAYNIGKSYEKGTANRQEILEVALKWISNGNPAAYMAEHQHDKDSKALEAYYTNVIEWIEKVFPIYREEMKGIDWGKLWNLYHENKYDANKLEKRISELMANEEVTEKKGVYEYVLSGESEDIAKVLSKRKFSDSDKRTAYERQKGIDPQDHKHYEFKDMEADHNIPWWKGGKTVLSNLVMRGKTNNRRKGGKTEKETKAA